MNDLQTDIFPTSFSSCFDVWIDRICDIRHYDELANGFAEIQKIGKLFKTLRV